MAGKIIKADTGEMRNTSAQITELAGEYKTLYEEVLGKIQDMNATWQFEDFSAYRDEAESFREDFVKMKQEMDRYAEFLITTAAAYEKVQDEAVNEAKTLIK